MKRIKPHLSYANVVATLALVLAVSGGATAIAITVSKNSVTTKSIRPGAVTARALGPTIERQATQPGGTSVAATCRKGERVVSGGGTVSSGNSIAVSGPTKNGWFIVPEIPGQTATAIAYCLRR